MKKYEAPKVEFIDFYSEEEINNTTDTGAWTVADGAFSTPLEEFDWNS